jgi:SAM-dependent methyltransferase
VIEHITDQQEVVREVARVLSPKGLLLTSTPALPEPGGSIVPTNDKTPDWVEGVRRNAHWARDRDEKLNEARDRLKEPGDRLKEANSERRRLVAALAARSLERRLRRGPPTGGHAPVRTGSARGGGAAERGATAAFGRRGPRITAPPDARMRPTSGDARADGAQWSQHDAAARSSASYGSA